jgi:RNA polymerase sigma factor (sigma-70 family)
MFQQDMYPPNARPIRKMQNLIFHLTCARRSIAVMAPTHVARDTERSRLIEQYLPLANGAARRFARRGVEREDLKQVAALAIVRAVDRRDPRRSELLPAYVSRSVEGELRRHLRDRVAAVRVPRAARADDTPARHTAEAPIPLGDEEWDGDDGSLEDVTLERALIARAARALDARQRRILWLRFFLDRTQGRWPKSWASPRRTSRGFWRTPYGACGAGSSGTSL